MVAGLQLQLGAEHPSALAQKGSRPLTSIISVATAKLDMSSNAFSLHEPMRWGGRSADLAGHGVARVQPQATRRPRRVTAILGNAVDRYQRLGAGQTEECMKARSHLATTRFEMGQISEACEQRRQIVGVRTTTLGPDDQSTLSSLENLASTLEWLDEFDEAEVIYRGLLVTSTRLLGLAHRTPSGPERS